MRVIKFRAWNKSSPHPHMIDIESVMYDEKNSVSICGYPLDRDNGGFTHLEGDKFDLMQFTGLTDKNGVDIYEGDIMLKVMVDDSIHRCVIRYSDKYAKFVFCPIMEKWDFDMDVMDNPYERQSYEVIGNIHENPELMESKNVQ